MYDQIWKSLLVEFLGTFILVFIGASAVALTVQQGGSLVGSALAFGFTLLFLYYSWGQYSGAHFNPAVSFGYAVAGRMPWLLMIGYWIAQLVGGIAAGALVYYFFGGNAGASIGSLTYTDPWKAVLLEAFLTFFLVMTILLVSANPILAVASGFAIGVVLTVDMLAGAPLTGASMNPARSLGPAIFGNQLSSYWIYIVGPLIGALVAALIWRLFNTDWGCCYKKDECGNFILDECGNKIKECKRPLVDRCGNPIKGDCGEKKWETYVKKDIKHGYKQENALSAIGDLMSSHGLSPQFISSEFQKAFPDGVAPSPHIPGVPASQQPGQVAAVAGQQAGMMGQQAAVAGQQAGMMGQQAAVAGQQAGMMGQQAAIAGQQAGMMGQQAAIAGQQAGLMGQQAAAAGQQAAAVGQAGVMGQPTLQTGASMINPQMGMAASTVNRTAPLSGPVGNAVNGLGQFINQGAQAIVQPIGQLGQSVGGMF